MSDDAPRPRFARTRRALRWGFGLFVSYMVLGFITANVRLLPEAPTDATAGTASFAGGGPVVTGVFSVHTDNSHDSWGTLDDVGAAGRAAGLDFVVLGDHPADPRRPNWMLHPTSFRDGVLVVQGQELVARRVGRVLGLGLDTTFHRWREGPDSLSDFFQRAGGSIFVTHGRSPRGTERWFAGLMEGLDGWEVLDMSESVKDRMVGPWLGYHLATLAAALPLGRLDAALLHLAARDGFDVPSVAAYDSLRVSSNLSAIAGLNHHSQLKFGEILLPPFLPFFRTLLNHVELDGPLATDPDAAERQVVDATLAGRVWMSMGRGGPVRAFRYGAYRRGERIGGMGESVTGDAIVLRAGFTAQEPPGVTYRVLRDGHTVAWIDGPVLEFAPQAPGRYRVEVYRRAATLGRWALRWRPWILTNPISVNAGPPPADSGGG